jgi:hypothetical protein
MPAISMHALDLPPVWYPAIEQIQKVIQKIQRLPHEISENQSRYISGASSTIVHLSNTSNDIEQLGWSAREALETHLRFRGFAQDWNAPGMDAYDDL